MDECKNRAAGSLEWKDGERERFEKWAAIDGYDLRKSVLSKYTSTLTLCAFDGYKSRQPEIDALKSLNRNYSKLIDEQGNEIDGLKVNYADLVSVCRGRAAVIETLEAENEKLRKDAERYRWLRDQNVEPFVEDGETVFSVCAETEFKWVGRDLDSVIDAAMNAPDTKGE